MHLQLLQLNGASSRIRIRPKIKTKPKPTPHLVISDELIREVETRMNRNYLPPALKLHCSNNAGQHSPPTVTPCPANTNPSTMLTARRTFGSRACKLPTVQEVGKLVTSNLIFCVFFFLSFISLFPFTLTLFFFFFCHLFSC